MSEPPQEQVSSVHHVQDEFYETEDVGIKDRYQNPRRPRKLRLYVNGDRYFRGKKIYITPSRYYNFNDLLSDLTGKLPSNLNLHYGVRQIFTPRAGRKILNIDELTDGEAYVCAGFEGFRMVKYGRSELEPWSVAHSQQSPMTEQEPEITEAPRYRVANNVFHPGRYFRSSLSYPQRKHPDNTRPSPRGYAGVSLSDNPRPSPHGYAGASLSDNPRPSPRGYAGASLSNSMHRPKVVTVIKSGPKPRNSIKILLNRRTVQSYEQLVADISEAFGSKLKTFKVHKLFTLRGREVQGISDFFRGDEYFVAFGGGDGCLSENGILDILEEICQDSSLAKRLLLDWRKNERRRRKISPENRFLRSNRDNLHAPTEQLMAGQGQDKRDSGFDSGDFSTNISEVEQIDRLGIVSLRKRNIVKRESENEQENRYHIDRLSQERRAHFLNSLKPKNVNKGVLTPRNEDIARLRGSRSILPEIERKDASDERRNKNITRLRNNDNHTKMINNGNHPRIMGESGATKMKGGVFVEEETRKYVDSKNTEIRENSLDLETKNTLVNVNDNAIQEINIQETDVEEKKSIDGMHISDNNRQKTDAELHKKAVIEQTVVTREVSAVADYSIDTSVNNKEMLDTETFPVGETQNVPLPVQQTISPAVLESASAVVSQTTNPAVPPLSDESLPQTDAKDKNNNNKEKRKPEREDQQQRKRVKTRIVRKTKIQRQVSSDEYVFSLYEVGRKLGDGNFAIVRHSRKKETGQEFAIKVIDKAKLKGKDHMVENEIDILKDCCHHNIVRLYEEYETFSRIYLVMELVKGGDLFDAITQSVKFPEVESALMVKDLCSALFYMHSRSIVHRDLKPENLLVHRSKDGSITLKLADFGLAMEVKQLIYTVCGTPTYVAPEILTDIGYGLEVDMWAVGVITYILLCGFPPFRSPDRNQTELFKYIKAGDFKFISPYWDNISRSAKDLISHLLVVDRKKRYTAIDVLCHKWVLCGGQVDVVPEGALTVDAAVRQARRELDLQAKLNYESYQRLKDKKKQELQRKEE